MKVAGYEFVDGARFQAGAKGDANTVGKRIEGLRKQVRGELTPKDVVDDARSPSSPLHTFFEWDDGEAAEKYRLQQARGLIRSVVAIYAREDKPVVRIRAFVHINEPGSPHYREAAHAMSLESTRRAVLQSAWRELQSWRRKYADLKEFSKLFEAIENAEATLPIKRAA